MVNPTIGADVDVTVSDDCDVTVPELNHHQTPLYHPLHQTLNLVGHGTGGTEGLG